MEDLRILNKSQISIYSNCEALGMLVFEADMLMNRII